VQDLSATTQYSSLFRDMNEAVQDGFMDLDIDKSNYRFVHDKVREAAYGMIHGDDKDRFHFDVGMALISFYKPQVEEKSHTLFDIIDQVNHGVPALLHDESQRISVAMLNLEAATNSMQSYDYTSAYRHAKVAVSLLPDDSWTTHHNLSLNSHLQLAKSAYPYSKVDEARNSLEKVMEHTNSLQTRLEAYKLLHSIILGACAPNDYTQLITTIAELLRSLGEDLPSDDDAMRRDLANQVFNTKKSFEEKSNDALMNMYGSGSDSQVAIVHAYSILVHLAYVAKPKLFPYYAARAVQYCLNAKVACKYVPGKPLQLTLLSYLVRSLTALLFYNST
jgi:predicted ATPase